MPPVGFGVENTYGLLRHTHARNDPVRRILGNEYQRSAPAGSTPRSTNEVYDDLLRVIVLKVHDRCEVPRAFDVAKSQL
jgi:hypothetical protein